MSEFRVGDIVLVNTDCGFDDPAPWMIEAFAPDGHRYAPDYFGTDDLRSLLTAGAAALGDVVVVDKATLWTWFAAAQANGAEWGGNSLRPGPPEPLRALFERLAGKGAE